MSDTLVNLAGLVETTPAPSRAPKTEHLFPLVSLAALKFSSENIDVAKTITSEGLTKQGRIDFIRDVADQTGKEIFEFSTCNRVLYVGFDIHAEALASNLTDIHGLAENPFEMYEGLDVWRQLVKVCSGLDSFIMGELQVMSQFRKAVNLHKEHGLINQYNAAFFEHVISANRGVRKQLGFTQTTESMLSLATTALENFLEGKGQTVAAVLGFGEMGAKAAEALLESKQTDVLVVSRNPEKSTARFPELAARCTMISYENWRNKTPPLDIVISTIRNAESTYHADHPLPLNSDATVMDFSWPPSIDASTITGEQQLMGMEHWIKLSHKHGKEWDYEAKLDESETVIDAIEKRFTEAVKNKSKGQFRAIIYGKMEELSKQWETSPHATADDVPQLGAFGREIATWICLQSGQFDLSDLSIFVANTERTLSSAMIAHVDHDVKRSVLALNEKSLVAGGAR